MTTKHLFLTILISLSFMAQAQADSLNLDMRADANSTTYDRASSSDFTKFYFKVGRLDYKGNVDENLSFRTRLAFNKNALTDVTKSPDSTSSYVEYVYLTNKFSNQFSLTVGKLHTEVGGFEAITSSAEHYLVSEAYTHKGPENKTATGVLGSNLFGSSEVQYMTGAKGAFTFDNQTVYLVVTNESTSESKTGLIASQNSSLWGAIWRGSFLDESLLLNASYHTMNGAAKDDKFLFSSIGAQWTEGHYVTTVDYLKYDFKQLASQKVDSLTSFVGKLAFTGWDQWTPRLELTSSEEKSEVAYTEKYRFQGTGLVMEFKPKKEVNFRYHIAYNSIKQEPNTGTSITEEEVVLGTRLNADFLK